MFGLYKHYVYGIFHIFFIRNTELMKEFRMKIARNDEMYVKKVKT